MSFKRILGPAVLVGLLCISNGSAMAAGTGRQKVTSNGNEFDNTGSIKAESKSTGGISISGAGQRVIAPIGTIISEHNSSNNRYRNSGDISAKSNALGGASTAIAGQDVNL